MASRPSQIITSQRYYERHREQILKRRRKYQTEHRDEINEKAAKWRKIHRDRGDVCDILTNHANDTADDPERLSSDFILAQIEALKNTSAD